MEADNGNELYYIPLAEAYYWGLFEIEENHDKALAWFKKAANDNQTRPIYCRNASMSFHTTQSKNSTVQFHGDCMPQGPNRQPLNLSERMTAVQSFGLDLGCIYNRHG